MSSFVSAHVAYTSTNKTKIVWGVGGRRGGWKGWEMPKMNYIILPRVDAPHVYVYA